MEKNRIYLTNNNLSIGKSWLLILIRRNCSSIIYIMKFLKEELFVCSETHPRSYEKLQKSLNEVGSQDTNGVSCVWKFEQLYF